MHYLLFLMNFVVKITSDNFTDAAYYLELNIALKFIIKSTLERKHYG